MRDDLTALATDFPPVRRRRELLKRVGFVAAGLGLGSLFGTSSAALSPFEQTTMVEVLRGLGATITPSSQIDLDLPDLSENGAMVPLSVTSRVPGTEQIFLLVEANPYPLVARFDIASGTEPFVSMRVKLAQSCTVSAVVRAGGQFYGTTRETAVTIGGCGG